MASSILNQIYKEAAVTSKGVVQMNRTLNKIYDDQTKSNKRQDKFVNEIRSKQKREEREEKKRQSDLKKAIAGVSGSRARSGKDENKLDLGGGKGGLVGAVVGGVTTSLGVLSTAIGALFKNKFAWMAAMLPLLRPILRGDGNRDPRHPSQRPNVDIGRDPRGENQTNPNQSATEQIQNTPLKELPALVGGVTGEDVIEGFTPSFRPNNAAAGPVKAVPKGNWFTKGMGKLGKMFGGFGKFLGKLAGPAILVWNMKDTVAKLWNNKQYKDLARYVIKTVTSYGLGILTGKALYGLAALLGIATGGTAAIPAFIGATLAASAVSGYSERAIDALLIKAGLTDESTGEEPAIPDKPEGLTAESLENAAGKQEELKEKLEPQKRQKGGGIFDVPGHGQGDQVPMMLPPGAFVLNRVAAQEMFARGGSPSGMVPTLLEPGEKVFMPGDPLMDVAMGFNSTFSRFQKGGTVGQPTTDTSSEKEATNEKDKVKPGGGGPAVLSVGKMLMKEGFSIDGHPNFQKVPRKFVPEGGMPTGRHSKDSLHYKGLAIDVTDWRQGDWKGRTSDLAERMYQNRKELKLTQIIHDPWGHWFDGMNKKGGAYGGHPDHLHLGFAAGKIDGKGYIGKKDDQDAPQSAESDSNSGAMGALGGALAPITSALDNVFSADGPFQKVMGALNNQMQSVASKMFEHLNSPEVKQLTSDIQEQVQGMMSEMFGSGSNQQVSSTKQASSEYMKTISQAMDPEANESPTIVQVVPGGESTEEATVNGQVNDNVPVGLSTRCSSWASADYRYDRSLNTETL